MQRRVECCVHLYGLLELLPAFYKMLVKGFQPPVVLGNPVLKSERDDGSEVFWCSHEGNQDLPDDPRAREIQGKGWLLQRVGYNQSSHHRPASKPPFCCFSPLSTLLKQFRDLPCPAPFCLSLAHPLQVVIRLERMSPSILLGKWWALSEMMHLWDHESLQSWQARYMPPS